MLLKLGEIVLKGRNRQQFERILHGNIRVAVRDLGVPVDLRQREGVILLRVADGEQRGEAAWAQAVSQIAERMRDVPGIVRVCLPLRVAKTPEAISAAAMALTKGTSGTFAVRARRRDKRFPLTSGQLGVLIGREIQEAHGLGVNLSQPGYHGVHRGGPGRGVRVHRGDGGAGRAAGGDERPRCRAHVRRHRLAGGRLPDDAPRPALLLPAFFRHAADRPGVDLQGLRAGPRA